MVMWGIVLGFFSFALPGVGIYGFFAENFILLYVCAGISVILSIVGIVSGQQKGLTTEIVAVVIGVILSAVCKIYWLHSIALCLCIESVITAVGGIILVILVSKKDSPHVSRTITIIAIVLLLVAVCALSKFLFSSAGNSSQVNEEATQGSATVTEEVTTEAKPVYASIGDIRVEITNTNYKHIKSYKKLNFSHSKDEADDDGEEIWVDFSDKEKKQAWENITQLDGRNLDAIVYQERISSDIFTLYKNSTSATGYNTIDEFLADYKFSDNVTVEDKHVDIDGVHAYMALEYSNSEDYSNCSEIIFVYNENIYILAFYPFNNSTDMEDKTNELASIISFK